MEYDEYGPKLTFRVAIAQGFCRILPHLIACVVIAILVAIGCNIAAKVENRAAADPWYGVIENAFHDGKNLETRQ